MIKYQSSTCYTLLDNNIIMEAKGSKLKKKKKKQRKRKLGQLVKIEIENWIDDEKIKLPSNSTFVSWFKHVILNLTNPCLQETTFSLNS